MAIDTASLATKTRAIRPAHINRIQGIDSLGAKELLQLAFHALEPADRTQRQAINALMPELYMLRNRGFSFPQITTLLSQCGFTLQPSTVRLYFTEMLAERQDECIRRMNEQMTVLAEITKETKGIELSMIANKAIGIIERQRSLASSKVEEVLEAGTYKHTRVISTELPAEPNTDQLAPQKKIGAAPRPTATATAVADDVGFGLAMIIDPKIPMIQKTSHTGNAFFDAPEDPAVPNLTTAVVNNNSGNIDINEGLKNLYCLPLQPGVKPLARRNDVPDTIYNDELMEHPDIPGLMLSLDDRLYGALLEFNDNGKTRIETVQEKSFRIKWQRPIPRTQTATGSDFVTMNNTLFKHIP